MSTQNALAGAQKWANEQPWRLYASQVVVLVRTEVRRNLFSKRRIWIYLLAFVPAIILLIANLFGNAETGAIQLEGHTEAFAGIVFQLYFVRLGIFFACMGIFTWLFRGEMVQKTLHYQFLSPVRREVLVVGKFLAGAVTSIALFEVAVTTSFYLTYSSFGSIGRTYVFNGPGLGQLGAYLLVTLLACLGYGAVFLALSLLFKNPIVPGVMLWGWEAISPIFPSWAQKLSVTFYLKHLCPVAMPVDGPMAIFTVVAEPVAPFLAIGGLLCLTVAVLVLSCFLIHRLEITYTVD
ncbi:MAG TPA: ABC transporter permease subunit [Candidatus Acidoferrum sp.]|nr:ABC transporter permease subunit [Candidatus Acidoferrum sp.]